jgi:LysM repeat protein
MRVRLGGSLLCVAVATGSCVPTAAAAGGTYVVKPHDTLSGIAQAYGTTVAALVSLNHLSNADLIVAGQVLVIGQSASYGTSLLSYVVQWGDTLAAIGQRFGVTVQALATANGIADPAKIQAGQQLVIPGASDNPVSASATAAGSSQTGSGLTEASLVSGTSYVVQAGDTLSAIGQRYGVSAQALAAANNLAIGALLQVGQQLAIPVSSGGSDAVGVVLAQVAQADGIATALLKALAWQESGWQMVTAADGGIGVMQLMPDSVTWVSQSLLGYQIDPYNITDNVRAGAAMLRYYLNVFGDVRLALAAYHQGLTSVETEGIQPDTQTYIANILALQQQYGG